MNQASVVSQVPPEQQELLELLQSTTADEGRIDELIDVLIASEQPFVEQRLGGGPWQVHCCMSAFSLPLFIWLQALACTHSITPGAARQAWCTSLLSCKGFNKPEFPQCMQVVYTKGTLLWQQLISPGAGGKRVRQGVGRSPPPPPPLLFLLSSL